jgi:hypothetical protein
MSTDVKKRAFHLALGFCCRWFFKNHCCRI